MCQEHRNAALFTHLDLCITVVCVFDKRVTYFVYLQCWNLYRQALSCCSVFWTINSLDSLMDSKPIVWQAAELCGCRESYYHYIYLCIIVVFLSLPWVIGGPSERSLRTDTMSLPRTCNVLPKYITVSSWLSWMRPCVYTFWLPPQNCIWFT